MISESFDPVSFAMWRTAVLMVAMSPLPVFPRVTPQSMTICRGPSAEGTVTRKKSPKPTRYIRTRSCFGTFFEAAPIARLLGLFFGLRCFAPAMLRHLHGSARNRFGNEPDRSPPRDQGQDSVRAAWLLVSRRRHRGDVSR